MSISEQCRLYEKRFPLVPTAFVKQKDGWTRYKQYSTPDDLRKKAKMFWNFGVSKEIRYELGCRRDNRSAKIMTWDPTPISQNTIDSANEGGYDIHHENKAYDKESGKALEFYAIDESKRCYQLDEPAVVYDKIKVETINLETISKQHGTEVDIIKLDIEGRWFEMLKEIIELELPVKCVLVECEMYITGDAFRKLDSIVERYQSSGFTVYTNRITKGQCVELCLVKNLS